MAFPSTPITGKLARITYAGTAIDFSSRWSINWSKDAAVFGRQGQEYKEAVPGQASWTGTAEFVFVRSSEQAALMNLAVSTASTPTLSTGTNSTIAFCFDSTANRLKGDVIVTSFTVDAPVGDVIKCTFGFQGSGVLEFSS